MSDVAIAEAEESVEAAASQEQAAAAQSGPPEWLSSLPEYYEVKDPKSDDVIRRPLRADKTLARYKDQAEAAKALIEANRTIGQGLNKIPGDEASAEEKRAFWDKLGVPSDIDGYADVSVPEVEGFTVDEDLLTFAKQTALKNGVLPSQFQAFVDLYAEMQQAEREKRINAWRSSHDPLQEEWGIRYKSMIGQAERTVRQHFDAETVGLIKAFGLDYHPGFIRGFHAIAAKMGEHGFQEGGPLGSMDTSAAKAKIDAIRKDPKHPAMDPSHRDHPKATAELEKLYRTAYPEPK